MKSFLSSPSIRSWLFVLLLVGLSLAPEPLKGRMATVGTLHRFAHIAAFCAGFFVIGIRSWRVLNPGWTAVALVILGGLLELFQSAVYGSRLEYEDILDDASGVAVAFLCQRFIRPPGATGDVSVPRSE